MPTYFLPFLFISFSDANKQLKKTPSKDIQDIQKTKTIHDKTKSFLSYRQTIYK